MFESIRPLFPLLALMFIVTFIYFTVVLVSMEDAYAIYISIPLALFGAALVSGGVGVGLWIEKQKNMYLNIPTNVNVTQVAP